MIGNNLNAEKLMTCVCKLEKSLVKFKNRLWHVSCNFRLGIQAQDIVDFLIRKEFFLVNLYL